MAKDEPTSYHTALSFVITLCEQNYWQFNCVHTVSKLAPYLSATYRPRRSKVTESGKIPTDPNLSHPPTVLHKGVGSKKRVCVSVCVCVCVGGYAFFFFYKKRFLEKFANLSHNSAVHILIVSYNTTLLWNVGEDKPYFGTRPHFWRGRGAAPTVPTSLCNIIYS